MSYQASKVTLDTKISTFADINAVFVFCFVFLFEDEVRPDGLTVHIL